MLGMWRRGAAPGAGGLWRDMERLHGEMERLFRRNAGTPEFPPINLWANADGLVVTAEMPGVAKEDVDIAVAGNLLTLRGKRGTPDEGAGAPHRRERRAGSFSRTFELPFTIDAGKVKATSRDGVLTVELPRAEADKPRKIEIQGA